MHNRPQVGIGAGKEDMDVEGEEIEEDDVETCACEKVDEEGGGVSQKRRGAQRVIRQGVSVSTATVPGLESHARRLLRLLLLNVVEIHRKLPKPLSMNDTSLTKLELALFPSTIYLPLTLFSDQPSP
jgi:hypothetical protein